MAFASSDRGGRQFSEKECSSQPSLCPSNQLSISSSLSDIPSEPSIILSADIPPYFDSSVLSVGLKIIPSATTKQTASEILTLVSDYLSSLTDETKDSNVSIINLDELPSDFDLATGLDAAFGVQLKLYQ